MSAASDHTFLERVSVQYGPHSAEWRADFPALLLHIVTKWELELGPAFVDATHYVRAARHIPTQHPVVLKIGYPAAEFHQELQCYIDPTTADRYPVRRIDVGLSAVLFDQLVPGSRLDEASDDPLWQIAVIAPLMHALPVNAAAYPLVPTLTTIAADVFPHAMRVLATGERPIAAEHLVHVQEIIAHTAEAKTCLLHGDIHPGNVLLSGSVYRLIDPLGLIAPPAVECCVFLRHLYLRGAGSRAARKRRVSEAIVQFATVCAFAASEVAQWNYCMMVIAAWWSFQSQGTISVRENEAVEDYYALYKHFRLYERADRPMSPH